jgi:hypothetical protein
MLVEGGIKFFQGLDHKLDTIVGFVGVIVELFWGEDEDRDNIFG